MLRMSLWGRGHTTWVQDFLYFLQRIHPDVHHGFRPVFTAPVLQGACNAGVQFFPVDAVVAVYRGVARAFSEAIWSLDILPAAISLT